MYCKLGQKRTLSPPSSKIFDTPEKGHDSMKFTKMYNKQCCNESPTGRVTQRSSHKLSRVISVSDRVESATSLKSSHWFKWIRVNS